MRKNITAQQAEDTYHRLAELMGSMADVDAASGAIAWLDAEQLNQLQRKCVLAIRDLSQLAARLYDARRWRRNELLSAIMTDPRMSEHRNELTEHLMHLLQEGV